MKLSQSIRRRSAARPQNKMADPKRTPPKGFKLDGDAFYDKKRREERYRDLKAKHAPGLEKWNQEVMDDGVKHTVYVVEWFEPLPLEERKLIN